jgi:3-(3-hydroxy-phenyl)propionate hydroxylase
MTAGGRLGTALRGIVAPRARFIPGLGAKVLDSRTPPLSQSLLVLRRRKRKQLAGSLCPNAVTAQGQRLDDVVGNRFAVITAVPPTPLQQDMIEHRKAVVHHVGPGTELGQWLNRGKVQAAVVRPDFTVMCAGSDLTVLCDALPAVRPK